MENKKSKKVRCAICGKEVNEEDAIPYTFSTCCGIDEVLLCKKCANNNQYYSSCCDEF